MDVDTFLETVRRYTDVTTITKRMVAEIIQYIEVYPAVKENRITKTALDPLRYRIAGKSPSGTFFWKREKA